MLLLRRILLFLLEARTGIIGMVMALLWSIFLRMTKVLVETLEFMSWNENENQSVMYMRR